jgi:DNA-binding transcriptional LysR family regulator
MKLPPLASFRFFDAAARTGSFVNAAQVLNVTHSAVSRQIRQLEAALGVALFERRNRAVYLTAAGRTLWQTTASVFEHLESTVEYLQQMSREDVLVVSCEPTIAMKWLIPRLPDFHRAHPGIHLHLVAAGGPVDFAREGVDLALRRDDFHWNAGIHATKICDEWMGPVTRSEEDISTFDSACLLYTGTRPEAWSVWQQQAGVPLTRCRRRDYEHFYLCVQAAVAGLGVAMVSFLMVQDELSLGQLHAPYGFCRDGSGYYLLSPVPMDGKRDSFCRWIMDRAHVCMANLPQSEAG